MIDKMKKKHLRLPNIHPKLMPKVEPYKKELYMVVDWFSLSMEFEGRKYIINVPPSFVFDGASIPRFAWSTTGSPFLPEYLGPALVHDYLYRGHKDAGGHVSRKCADKLFRYLLKLNGVSRYQRNKMYLAVRVFGKFSW